MSQRSFAVNKKFIFGIALNSVFIAVELIYGYKTKSLALIADAVHNMGDVFGLLIAWLGFYLAQKKASEEYTYGYKSATVIAAFVNALILFVAVGEISWEAFKRFGVKQSIDGSVVIFVAFIGIFINALTAYFFFHDRKKDINIQGAFLHMVLDALVSVGVVISGFFMLMKGWYWIDPFISLLIALAVLLGSWRLFKDSLNLMLLAVPTSIDLKSLKALVHESRGVIAYHHLHVWPMSTTEVALSVHLVVESESLSYGFLREIEKKIKENFPISHTTIQLELKDESVKGTFFS